MSVLRAGNTTLEDGKVRICVPIAYETEKETLENEEMNLCHMTGEHHVFHADIYLKDEQELDLDDAQ